MLNLVLIHQPLVSQSARASARARVGKLTFSVIIMPRVCCDHASVSYKILQQYINEKSTAVQRDSAILHWEQGTFTVAAMPRPSLAKLHPHLAHVGID
jgi:hypothetical protein